MGVVKEVLPKDVAQFHRFLKGDIYVDDKIDFFRAINGGKVRFFKNWQVLTAWTTWKAIFRLTTKIWGKNRIRIGGMGGEGGTMGGIALISKNGVHYVYQETVGELPSMNELLAACRKVSGLSENGVPIIQLPQIMDTSSNEHQLKVDMECGPASCNKRPSREMRTPESDADEKTKNQI